MRSGQTRPEAIKGCSCRVRRFELRGMCPASDDAVTGPQPLRHAVLIVDRPFVVELAVRDVQGNPSPPELISDVDLIAQNLRACEQIVA